MAYVFGRMFKWKNGGDNEYEFDMEGYNGPTLKEFETRRSGYRDYQAFKWRLNDLETNLEKYLNEATIKSIIE